MADENKPFIVYDVKTDNLVPLTHEYLAELLAVHREYGQILDALKKIKVDIHDKTRVEVFGLKPIPW